MYSCTTELKINCVKLIKYPSVKNSIELLLGQQSKTEIKLTCQWKAKTLTIKHSWNIMLLEGEQDTPDETHYLVIYSALKTKS